MLSGQPLPTSAFAVDASVADAAPLVSIGVLVASETLDAQDSARAKCLAAHFMNHSSYVALFDDLANARWAG